MNTKPFRRDNTHIVLAILVYLRIYYHLLYAFMHTTQRAHSTNGTDTRSFFSSFRSVFLFTFTLASIIPMTNTHRIVNYKHDTTCIVRLLFIFNQKSFPLYDDGDKNNTRNCSNEWRSCVVRFICRCLFSIVCSKIKSYIFISIVIDILKRDGVKQHRGICLRLIRLSL